MKTLTLHQFNQLTNHAHIKPRLKRDIRFIASTSNITDTEWRQTELLAISDRSGGKGVLLVAPDDQIFVFAYELAKGITNRQTGRAQAVICDFCKTWQSGRGAGSISFFKGKTTNTVTFLCCADLACSKHVRTKTDASRISRAQLREDLTNEQRVERLKERLRQLIDDLG